MMNRSVGVSVLGLLVALGITGCDATTAGDDVILGRSTEAVLPTPQLTPGAIAFAGFNGEGTDGFAFVALNTIPAGQIIYFTDNEWNGSAIGSGGDFNTGESTLTWINGGTDLAPGAVVELTNINSSTPSTNIGNAIVDAPFDIEGANETIYAYVGNGTPAAAAFLTAITNSVSGFQTNSGTLSNTGLTSGVNALQLPIAGNGADVAAYNPTSGGKTFASSNAARSAFNNSANWVKQADGANQDNDGISPDAPFLTDPQSPLAGVTFSFYNVINGTTDSGQTLTGTSGPDYINARNGDDTLIGLGGDDRLYGNGGADILRPGAGSDTVYGGAGSDTVDYSDATGAIYLDLNARYARETALTVGTVTAVTPIVSTDNIFEVENVIGSDYGDRIYGTTADNVITPGRGADAVYCGAGNDTVAYGNAAGAIYADLTAKYVRETGLQSGTVNFEIAAITTDYVFDAENINGSPYGDRLYGTATVNTLSGGDGNDVIYALDGDDILIGGNGADVLIGGNGSDTLTGGSGADQYAYVNDGTTGVDTITDFDTDEDTLMLHGFAPDTYAPGDQFIVTDPGNAFGFAVIIYDSTTGDVSFDNDGDGVGEIPLANIGAGLTFSSSNVVAY